MSRTFNFRLVLLTMGALLTIEAFFMAMAMSVAYIYDGYDAPYFLHSTLITLAAGIACIVPGYRAEKRLGRREGYIIVALVWVVFSLFGLLPFYLSNAIPTYTDAFFETMSGFTTTGSTILTNIEALPHGLLFWRCLTQWLGGMGIIVLSLAILPLFGLGGMQLYAAEATGPTYEKLRPRIKDTAKIMWGIYLMLTLIECGLLYLCGMSGFDAICHAFSTMSTGGYSTKNASIAAFQSPLIEYIIVVFMFFAAINFTLLYYVLRGRGKRLYHDEEARYYMGAVGLFTICIAAGLLVQTVSSSGEWHVERAFRTALFQVVSLLTSTGFATADYMTWLPSLTVLCLFLMIPGGSAGSTAGGMKWVRIIILVKNGYYEFRRLIHPTAIIPVRFNEHAIPNSVVNNIVAFITIYVGLMAIGVLAFSTLGIDFEQAVGASISSIGNVGPGLGASGPSGSFVAFPAVAKWIMAFMMLVGRLELFTVLFLFVPAFWKK